MLTSMHRERVGSPNRYDIERGHRAVPAGADGHIAPADGGAPSYTQPPPSIKLSPYHFLNISIIFAFGCWKAVASYRGQATLPITLDMLVGTILPLVYVC